jgi:paraquat-inducible protein A
MPDVEDFTDQPAAGLTARRAGLMACAACRAVYRIPADDGAIACLRCGATVRSRKIDSIHRSWALLLAATALYVPANLLPVMRTSSVFASQDDTIMSGIVYLWADGSQPLAVLVFVASIVVPLSKLVILSYLLISAQRHSRLNPQRRTRLYRVLELVGRWSMLDIFVVTLLAALVQLGAIANIDPGPGAAAFGSVVVLTMMATHSFDPRLIWDPLDPPGTPPP